MPLLLADFIYSRNCKPNLQKNVDTTMICEQEARLIPTNKVNRKGAIPDMQELHPFSIRN